MFEYPVLVAARKKTDQQKAQPICQLKLNLLNLAPFLWLSPEQGATDE